MLFKFWHRPIRNLDLRNDQYGERPPSPGGGSNVSISNPLAIATPVHGMVRQFIVAFWNSRKHSCFSNRLPYKFDSRGDTSGAIFQGWPDLPFG
jgi:hypothetical protein